MQQRIGNHSAAAPNSLQTRLSLMRTNSGTSALAQAAPGRRSAKDYAERSSDPRGAQERDFARQTEFEKAREHDGMVQYSIDDNACTDCTPISQSRIVHYHGLPMQYTQIDKCAKIIEWR